MPRLIPHFCAEEGEPPMYKLQSYGLAVGQPALETLVSFLLPI
jgi:hypothetical protein